MLLPWPHHKSKPKPKDVWKWEGIQNRLLLHLTADKGNKHHNKSVCPLSGLDYLEAIWINSQLWQEALGLDLSPSFDCHFPIVFLFQWRQHTCSLMFHSGLAVPDPPREAWSQEQRGPQKEGLSLRHPSTWGPEEGCRQCCSFVWVLQVHQASWIGGNAITCSEPRVPTTERLLGRNTKMCPFSLFSKPENYKSRLCKERFCSFYSLC